MAPALRETAAPLPLPLREGVTQLDGDAVAPRVPLCFGEAVGAPLLPLGDRVGVALPLQLPPFAQPTDDIDALPEMLAEMEAERDSPCEADGVGEGAGDRESQLAEGDAEALLLRVLQPEAEVDEVWLRLRVLVTVEDTDRQAMALRDGVPHAVGLAVRDAVLHALRERLPLVHALTEADMLGLRLPDGECEDEVLPDTEALLDSQRDTEEEPVVDAEVEAFDEGLALRLRVGEPLREGVALTLRLRVGEPLREGVALTLRLRVGEPLREGVADVERERVAEASAEGERGGGEALGEVCALCGADALWEAVGGSLEEPLPLSDCGMEGLARGEIEANPLLGEGGGDMVGNCLELPLIETLGVDEG